MRKLFAVVACLGLFAAVANADSFHFYFSTYGAGFTDAMGTDPVPTQVPDEYVGGYNPTVVEGETVYVWVYMGDSASSINGLAMTFDKDGAMPLNPPLMLVPSQLFAFAPFAVTRWHADSDFDPIPDGLWNGIALGGATGIGPANLNDPSHITGIAFNLHYLVGEITVGEVCDVWMGTGPGVSESSDTHPYDVYYGFTEGPPGPPFPPPPGIPDGPVDGYAVDQFTLYPDLHVIPEPASLLLLGLGVLALRRR